MSADHNGWITFAKPGRGSFLQPYANRIVIIVARGKGKAIYLTRAVMEALGKPEYVEIKSRGSNIGLIKSEGQSGYKVIKDPRSQAHHISGVGVAKAFHLTTGVYTAHIETGMVIFDHTQTPSSL